MKLFKGYRIINRKKLLFTLAADMVGNIICLPKRLLKKKRVINPDEIKNILVIRTAYIGDVIMTLPLLKPLKERFKNSRITFLTSAKAEGVLQNNPYIDEIITYDPFWFYPTVWGGYFKFIKGLKERAFDIVIESRGDIRELLLLVMPLKSFIKISYGVGGGGFLLTDVVPSKGRNHRVEYHLDIAKCLGCDTRSNMEWGVYLNDAEEKRISSMLNSEGLCDNDTIVAIHPGARKDLKCWSPEGYAAVADAIINEFGFPVLLTGTPEEIPLVKKVEGMMLNKPVVIAGKTKLRELAGILDRCALFICNDSSPMHIAAAMKTPTVAVFGPSKSLETGPYGNIYRVVEKDFPCRYNCDENTCRHTVYKECMKTITPDDVYSAVHEILSFKNIADKKLLVSGKKTVWKFAH